TSLEWVLLDWALMSIGAVVIGLYPTSSAKECAYILDHSEAVLVIVEDEEQRAKVEAQAVLAFGDLEELAAEGRASAADDPRVFEKVRAGIEAGFAETTGVKRALVEWALRTGAHRDERRVRAAIADRLVFSKVMQRLGGRLRIGLSGGAPLATEHLEFFRTIGLLVVEGYGLTETASSCTVNRPDAYRFGPVREPVAGCEVRLADDGELLVRSATIFAGYYKDEEATRAAFTDDGWFRTGDVGEIDADGYVRITDRKKDLIITAGGKNIAPQNLENALKAHREISQALVVGDRRPYVAALVT